MWDVIVVGARTAGAPLAMLLARAGLRVLLTDRAAFPSDTLSTHQMQVPAAARLARWELLDTIASVTPATAQIRLDAGGAVVAGRCPNYRGISAMYSPRRTLLDAVLVDAARAAGAEVRERFTVKELRWTSGCVTGIRGQERGRGPVTETARLVVGADGKHSFVADGVASPRYRKRPAATFASYSYWSDVPMTSGELYQRPERAAAAFPTNDGLTMVYVAAPICDFPSLRRNIEGHFLRTVDGCGDLGERLRAGARVERIRTTPDLPIWLRIPSGPGWALAGDAGLVMDPVTAHGMSNAFADADLLAAAITTGLWRPCLTGAGAGPLSRQPGRTGRSHVRPHSVARCAPPPVQPAAAVAGPGGPTRRDRPPDRHLRRSRPCRSVFLGPQFAAAAGTGPNASSGDAR
jgi:flavin-dependent dehydrogenase